MKRTYKTNSVYQGGTKIVLASLAAAMLTFGTTAFATYDQATNTDTLTNRTISAHPKFPFKEGDLSEYNHSDRNLVINWDAQNGRGDGSAIRDANVNAKNITITADFPDWYGWVNKGIISDYATHVTASGDINITTYNDGVYTESNGTTTIDGFKNLTIKATGDNWLKGGGFGVVDNGGGINIQGSDNSTVDISTVTTVQAAVGNSVRYDSYNVGTGVTISVNKITLDAPGRAIYAAPGKNGDFTVKLNAPTVIIKNGAIDAEGGRVSINPTQDGKVQINGDVLASKGGSIDLNLGSDGSFVTGNIKTEDVYSSWRPTHTANDNASITARFTGTNAQMTGDIQTVTDHSTITADFSGDNGTLTGDVKATGLAPKGVYSWTGKLLRWDKASGTTLNLNMTGANTSQTGNLVADGNNTLNANYTGTGSSLTGDANNTGIMNLTFDNQSQMTGKMTNSHADYDDGTSFDGQLKADFNNGSRWTGDLTNTAGTANVGLDNGSTWEGNLSSESGSTAVSLNNGSVWNGTASGNGDINLANNSLWNLTADSTANSVNPDGSSLISLAGTARKLETQSLGGSGGTFLMDLNYQGDDVTTYRDGNSSDFIVAHGGNGSTYGVALSGDSNVNGMTDGSKLYFASTATNSSAFQLNQNIEIQNYNKIYNKNLSVLKDTGNLSVKKDTDATGSDFDGYDNWYLTPDTSKGNDGNTINPNGIVPGTAANAVFALWRDDDTLLKRLGELRYNQQDDGIWARLVNKHLERDGRHGFEGNYKTIQVGYDKKKDTAHNGSWYYGGAVSHLWGDTDYTDGHGSQKETDLSLYGTNIRPHGHYLDLIARVGRIDSDYTTSYSDRGQFENWGMSIGAEYGRKKALGSGWSLEPQAQLTYHYLWGDDYTTSNGAKVSQDNADSLVGRLGFVLGKEFKVGTPHAGRVYLKASVLHDFLGDTSSSITDDLTYHDDDDLGDTWYVAGIGTDVYLGSNTRFYFDAERNFNADVKMKYRFNAGLRFGF